MSNGQTLEQQQLITKFTQELLTFLRQRPGVALESLAHSTPEMSFDLGKVRKNQVIHNRAGDRIFVMNLTGIAYIRFNSATGSKYQLRVGSISTPFRKLYLENEAQTGKSVSMIIGYGAFVDFASAYLKTKILKPDDSEVNPASEEKQDSILGQLDKKTSTLATQATLALVKAKTDNLNLSISALRDAIAGATPKTLKQIWDVLTTISGLDFASDTGLAVIADLDFAEQTTLALVKAKTDNLNLSISALRDAIAGATPKTLKQIWDVLTTISGLDFASDTGLAVIADLDFAEQTTLALMKTKIDDTFTEVQKLSTPVSNHDVSTGAALTVSLEVGHRRFVEVWMKTSAAATFNLYGSKDNINWRECDEIEFDGAGELKNGYWNADKYVKASTTDANNNEIEISAS